MTKEELKNMVIGAYIQGMKDLVEAMTNLARETEAVMSSKESQERFDRTLDDEIHPKR